MGSLEHMGHELANIAEQVRDLMREKRSDKLEGQVELIGGAMQKILGMVEEMAMTVGDLEERIAKMEGKQ